MNIIYISPQFPSNFINFCTRLKNQGVNVLGIASDSYDSLPDELKWALTEYYRVDNMNDYSQMLQAGRFFKEKYGRIDRIESHAEYWLPVDAALREDLGVWGRKREETAQSRHKSLMKDIFRSIDIPVVSGELVRDFNNAKLFASKVGYPLILKPDSGVGATATWRIDNEAELTAVFRDRDLTGYFIEEFIEGQIFTFDGLTDINGNLVYNNGLIYGEGIMEVVNADNHVFYYTAREMAPDLIDVGMRTLRKYDLREKFFHFEFFRRARDQVLFGLEVNIRPPGGLTVDMWNYADDIDIYNEWAKLVAFNKFDAKWNRKYHVAHVGRKDNISYVHSHDEVLGNFGSMIAHHERLSPLFRNALGDTSYLVKARSTDEILNVVDFIHKKTS